MLLSSVIPATSIVNLIEGIICDSERKMLTCYASQVTCFEEDMLQRMVKLSNHVDECGV